MALLYRALSYPWQQIMTLHTHPRPPSCWTCVCKSEMAVSHVEVSLSEYAQGLSVSDKRRYIEKISSIQDPYCIVASELSKDILLPVQCTDVFNYLVLSKRFCTSKSFCTSKRFKVFKSLEAYRYFKCGFVNYLGSKKFGNKYATVAKVLYEWLC